MVDGDPCRPGIASYRDDGGPKHSYDQKVNRVGTVGITFYGKWSMEITPAFGATQLDVEWYCSLPCPTVTQNQARGGLIAPHRLPCIRKFGSMLSTRGISSCVDAPALLKCDNSNKVQIHSPIVGFYQRFTHSALIDLTAVHSCVL